MKLASIDCNIGATPTLDYCDLTSDKLSKKYINRFYVDLNKDRKKDMTFFFNNLNTLEIKKVPSTKGIISRAGAQYCMNNNVIEIIDYLRFNDFIDHELLHLSSSIKDEDGNLYSGFIQTRGEYGIGYGLDEGYTSLLDDRYFLHRSKTKEIENLRIYQIVKIIAKRIEEFIGKEEMEDLYFTADLLSLVNTLSKYTSISSTTKFLHNLDEILLYYEQAPIRNIPLCYRKYSECMLFICEAWLYRVDEGYINGQINKEEYNHLLEMIKTLLNSRITMVHLPIRSVKLDKFYPAIKEKVAKKLELKYKEK